MAMSTSSASALTRGAKRLKDLAHDAVVLPTAQELYARKATEIEAAKAELARTVSRIIEQEKLQPSQRRGYAELLAAKPKQKATIERLCDEAGVIKMQIIAARPKPPLKPETQAFLDGMKGFDPHAKVKRGTAEQIAEAEQALAVLVREYRITQPTGNAREKLDAKLNIARLRLTALQGPPYPAWRPWASDETLKAERRKLGLE